MTDITWREFCNDYYNKRKESITFKEAMKEASPLWKEYKLKPVKPYDENNDEPKPITKKPSFGDITTVVKCIQTPKQVKPQKVLKLKIPKLRKSGMFLKRFAP